MKRKLMEEIKRAMEYQANCFKYSYQWGFERSTKTPHTATIMDCSALDIRADVPILLDSVLITMGHCIYAMTLDVSELLPEWGFSNVIVVDNYFMELSPISQKFLIYHEIGHLVVNEMEKINSLSKMVKNYLDRKRGSSRSLEMEMQADLYACLHIGTENSAYAIKEIYENMPLDLRIANTKEIQTRYHFIKDMLQK